MAGARLIVPPEKLMDLTVRILGTLGVPAEHARITAEVLVASDLRGVESHGVAHLEPFYVRGIREGRINPQPQIRLVSRGPAVAVIDRDQGLGFVVGHHAMTEAMERAEKSGAGLVAVRNSTHFGPAFYYAMMAPPRGMIGISLTTGGNITVPPGGARRTYGANALSVAAPAGDGAPFVLDMSTSIVAGGKIELAARDRRRIPRGWALDRDGHPTREPDDYLAGGGILPLGGTPKFGAYKGFGLALAVDILCGLLSGSGASVHLARLQASHFFGALRIEAFLPLAEFSALMGQMVETLKAAPRAPGAGPLRIAGEVEHALEEERRAAGIPLHPEVVDSLQTLCQELGVTDDLR